LSGSDSIGSPPARRGQPDSRDLALDFRFAEILLNEIDHSCRDMVNVGSDVSLRAER
jgi:hypothetical protein